MNHVAQRNQSGTCSAGIAGAELRTWALPTVSREANSSWVSFSWVSFVASKVMTRSMDCFQQSRVVNFAQAVKIKAAQLAVFNLTSAHFAFWHL